MLTSLMQRVFNKSKELEQVGAISGDQQSDYVDNAFSFTETAHKYARYSKGGGDKSALERIKLPTFVQERSSIAMSNGNRRGNKDIS